ncbi:MAG: VOC family protein [Thermoleophilia bacterium]
MSDLGRALGFYRDRLGFAMAYAFPDPDEPAFVSLEVDGGSLGLAASEDEVIPGTTAVWAYCDDVDALVARLRSAGVPVLAEPSDTDWGERMATVADPDGHVVHLGRA